MSGEELFYGTLGMIGLCVWWVVCWIGEHS